MDDGSYVLGKCAERREIISFILPPALLSTLSPTDEIYLQLTSKANFCLTINGCVYEGSTLDENPDLIDCFREESDGEHFTELGQVSSVMQVMRTKTPQTDLHDTRDAKQASSALKKCNKSSLVVNNTTILSDDDDDESAHQSKKGKSPSTPHRASGNLPKTVATKASAKKSIHREESRNATVLLETKSTGYTQADTKTTNPTNATDFIKKLSDPNGTQKNSNKLFNIVSSSSSLPLFFS